MESNPIAVECGIKRVVPKIQTGHAKCKIKLKLSVKSKSKLNLTNSPQRTNVISQKSEAS